MVYLESYFLDVCVVADFELFVLQTYKNKYVDYGVVKVR